MIHRALLVVLATAASAHALEPWGLPDLREPDKQSHALGGAVIGILATATAQRLMPRAPWWQQALIGTAVAAVAGALKEVVDVHTGGHDSDPKDAIATTAGGAAGALAITLVWRF